MADSYQLVAHQCYRVVRTFTDYDQRLHPVGETWEFLTTSFLPYDDGLTLHVRHHGQLLEYRLQWRPEEQAAILENFTAYVAQC